MKETAMTYELLPEDEPGNPLPEVSADFTANLMTRIAEDQRKRRRRRTAAIALTTIFLVGGTYALAARWVDEGSTENDARTYAASKAAPVVKTAPSPPPSPQNAVKRDGPAPRATSHAPSPPADALTADSVHPGRVVIIFDGKEIRDPAQIKAILSRMHKNSEQNPIELVRDGKRVPYPAPAGSVGKGPGGTATPQPPPQ